MPSLTCKRKHNQKNTNLPCLWVRGANCAGNVVVPSCASFLVPSHVFAGGTANETTALTLYSDNAESVEWFNMCWRKVPPPHLSFVC